MKDILLFALQSFLLNVPDHQRAKIDCKQSKFNDSRCTISEFQVAIFIRPFIPGKCDRSHWNRGKLWEKKRKAADAFAIQTSMEFHMFLNFPPDARPLMYRKISCWMWVACGRGWAGYTNNAMSFQSNIDFRMHQNTNDKSGIYGLTSGISSLRSANYHFNIWGAFFVLHPH